MEENLNIIQPELLFAEIDRLVNELGMTVMDSIVSVCDRHNIEIETAAAMIKMNSKILSELQIEGEGLNYLPKSRRLPI